MYDLLFFCSIISIFIVAYGVATESIIYPMGKVGNANELFNIVWRPYIHLFGELALDDLEDQLGEGYCTLFQSLNNTSDMQNCKDEDWRKDNYDCDDDAACRSARLVIKISLAFYMMLASALMLNLLIAVFSKTYDNMYEHQDIHWKWQRYELMMEFKHRSAIPFPLNAIAHTWRLARWVWRRCCTRGSYQYFERRDAQKKNDEFKKAEISLLERECMRNIFKRQEEKQESEKEKSLEKGRDQELRYRAGSPSKRVIPKPYGHVDVVEYLDDVEVDSLLVQAVEMPVTFFSPTTPPITRRETRTGT